MKKVFYHIILMVIPVLIYGFSSGGTNQILTKGKTTYLANTVVVKLKHSPVSQSNKAVKLPEAIIQKLEGINITSSKHIFKDLRTTANSLSRIIVIKYENNIDPYEIVKKIKNSDEVEWAEPKFIYNTTFTPNDPSLSNQYSLVKIDATSAWDLSKGDSSIVIGIVDTGIDWDHPDLAANIWANKKEIPGNGIDDDQNGYVDDIRGWDFGGLNGTPDNNPTEDRPDHGTHVAGIASASTNNGIGVASIGYKTKLMPVKVTVDNYRDSQTGSPYIVYGYEGIVYAIDNGAKVINCSWGGDGYSSLGQEVIDYAVSKGVLVVSAAGNDNSNDSFYPAGYRGVLAVASTDETDIKSYFSNYGEFVDVAAPGSNIYSTWKNDTYYYLSGTSMASPLTAGLAALVTSHFPSYTPLQVGEQIRVNCDDIDSKNPDYEKQMGRGRINAYKALSNTNSISVRAIDVVFSDAAPGGNGDGILQSGETITVQAKFRNYLGATNNLNISLESKTSYATVVNSYYNAGAVATLDSFDNTSNKFSFKLGSRLPENVKLSFSINYNDGTYNDFQWISTTGNQTYADQSTNKILLTLTSKGNLGFNDYPNNLQGNGFHFLDGPNLLFEGAFMVGTSPSKISDAARNVDAQDKDFKVTQPFTLKIPGVIADQEGTAAFNDDNAGITKIGVTVNLHSYSFSNVDDDNYIILKYHITNNSGVEINNLYSGLFFDWDMIEASGLDDITAYDSSGNFGYVYHEGGAPDTYIGIALLSSDKYGFWAILNTGGDGGFSIFDSDGFSAADKWQALSGGIGKPKAGAGDISNVTSSGPYTIPVDYSIDVAFAVAAALNKDELKTAIETARIKYGGIVSDVEENHAGDPLSFSVSQNYPNPFNPNTVINYTIPHNSYVTLKIFDVLGNEISTIKNEFENAGKYEVNFNGSRLASGIYFYKITADNFSLTKKMILMK